MRPNRKGNGGYTLIELLTVVAIIGMLASIISASVNVARMKARDAKRIIEIRSMIVASETYHTDHDYYYCSNTSESNNSLSSTFLQDLVSQGYLPQIPRDPLNTDAYKYWYQSYKSTPGGQCGQYLELNYDREYEGTPCAFGGKLVSATHCHVLYPEPLPCPGNEHVQIWPEFCAQSLRDPSG